MNKCMYCNKLDDDLLPTIYDNHYMCSSNYDCSIRQIRYIFDSLSIRQIRELFDDNLGKDNDDSIYYELFGILFMFEQRVKENK